MREVVAILRIPILNIVTHAKPKVIRTVLHDPIAASHTMI